MYTKSGDYKTLDEYVLAKTGKTVSQIDIHSFYVMANLDRAADLVIQYAKSKKPIVIYADYDVDGITAATEGILLCTYLGANFWVYAPKRSVDGYGLSIAFVEKLKNCEKGLLVTVDNGIAAIEQIKLAKSYGWEVLVMDHHLAAEKDGQIVIPDAGLIIDPEVFAEGCTYTHYCGAGLIYKLGERIVADKSILDQMRTLAAIGTVGDCVSLTDDNRQITRNGLWDINSGKASLGVNKMIERLGLTGNITSQDLAFKIVPMLNAASRLETMFGPHFSGSDFVIQALLEQDEANAAYYAMQLSAINEQRKQITEDAINNINTANLDKVNFIKVQECPAGILGIIAAKISERTDKPTFVCSQNKQGICVGSARSGDSDNNVKEMLDHCSDKMLRYGGHPGAAGFSFKAENFDAIKDILNNLDVLPAKGKTYDLEISAQEIIPTLARLDSLEPFGKDFERPVFKINCNLTQKEYWHAMGKDSSHLSLDLLSNTKGASNTKDASNVKGVYFFEKANFMNHGCPRQFTIYGTPAWNFYNGSKYPQFKIDHIEY